MQYFLIVAHSNYSTVKCDIYMEEMESVAYITDIAFFYK
jgi:hypothetical protein